MRIENTRLRRRIVDLVQEIAPEDDTQWVGVIMAGIDRSRSVHPHMKPTENALQKLPAIAAIRRRACSTTRGFLTRMNVTSIIS